MDFLSSNIFTNNVRAGTDENITLCGVHRKRAEGLADYLRGKLKDEPSLTLRKIAERSGGGVTHSYLSKIISGAASNPSVDKLKAIADGLGVSFNEVSAAAGGELLEEPSDIMEEVGVLFYGWDEASDEAKANTRAAIRMIAESFQSQRQRNPKPPEKAKVKGKK